MALGSGGAGGGASGIKAGAAYVQLFVKNTVGRDLATAQKQLGNFGNWIGRAGQTMAAAGAAAGVGLGAMSARLNDIAKQGGIASALGMTADQFTGIAGLAKSVGNDTKEFVESLVTMGNLGRDAAAGTEVASKAFADMGLNANEFIKLRPDEQFWKTVEALKAMTDGGKRTNATMKSFGEDGGKLLLPLLSKSTEELKRMAAGFTISAADMKAATASAAAYSEATTSISKAWTAVSVGVAPVIKQVADGIALGANSIKQFAAENKEVVLGLTLAVGGTTALGLGMMALGPALKVVALGWGAVGLAMKGVLGIGAMMKAMLLAPVLAIPAALVGAGAAWLAFTDKGRETAKEWGQAISASFMPTFENLKRGWKGVVDSVGRGDMQHAFNLGMKTMTLEWERMCIGMEAFWEASFGRMRRLVDAFGKAALQPPAQAAAAAGIPGVGGGKRQGKPLQILGMALGHIERNVFGNERVDKQVEGAEKFNHEMNLLGKQIQKVADAGADKREDEWQKRLNAIDMEIKVLQGLKSAKNWLGDTGGWLQGGWDDMKRLLAPDLEKQIAQVGSSMTRGTWGGNANSGFFGEGGGAGKQIVDQLKGVNDLLKKNNELTAKQGFQGTPLMFVPGT